MSVIISPPVNELFFNDIEKQGANPLASEFNDIIQSLNFTPINQDFFDAGILASRCVFSKELANLTDDNLLKNISQIGRYTINKTIKEGIQVREIDITNNADA